MAIEPDFAGLVEKKRRDRAKLIEHLLSEVEIHLDDLHRTNDFIESLREQFDRSGDLSVLQIEGLNKFYSRI